MSRDTTRLLAGLAAVVLIAVTVAGAIVLFRGDATKRSR